jgi:hypothetical protein
MVTASAAVAAPKSEPLFENSGFEKGDLSNWTAEGEAFKLQPVTRKRLRHQGKFMIATAEKNTGEAGTPEGKQGDEPKGKLTSPEFTIAGDYIRFLVGGGAHNGTSVRLLCEGNEYYLSSGFGFDTLIPVLLDVRKLKGKRARLVVMDEEDGRLGRINVDDFTATDEARDFYFFRAPLEVSRIEYAAHPRYNRYVRGGFLLPPLANVSYGPHPRHRMHFWPAESDKPLGVMLIIHGGGWYSGFKPDWRPRGQYPKDYHVCAVDYPLIGRKKADQLPSIVYSAARAVQFLRYKAKEWNIDPDRIVARGESAGGASSLWLALHDDMADPDSEDPVLRQSSRIAGAFGGHAQTTLDVPLIHDRIGPQGYALKMVWGALGAESAAALKANWDQYKELALECSALTHVSKDDPPVYVRYTGTEPIPATHKMMGIHHWMFGKMLKEKCDEVGTTCYLLFTKEVEGHTNPPMTPDAFLEKILCPEKEGK